MHDLGTSGGIWDDLGWSGDVLEWLGNAVMCNFSVSGVIWEYRITMHVWILGWTEYPKSHQSTQFVCVYSDGTQLEPNLYFLHIITSGSDMIPGEKLLHIQNDMPHIEMCWKSMHLLCQVDSCGCLLCCEKVQEQGWSTFNDFDVLSNSLPERLFPIQLPFDSCSSPCVWKVSEKAYSIFFAQL